MLSGRPSVCPLTPISRDAITLYLVDEVKWKMPRIFLTWVELAKRFSRSEVKCQCGSEAKCTFPIDLLLSARCPSVNNHFAWAASFPTFWNDFNENWHKYYPWECRGTAEKICYSLKSKVNATDALSRRRNTFRRSGVDGYVFHFKYHTIK